MGGYRKSVDDMLVLLAAEDVTTSSGSLEEVFDIIGLVFGGRAGVASFWGGGRVGRQIGDRLLVFVLAPGRAAGA